MNSKRSIWKVILGVVGMGLLVTNCTIKSDDDSACTEGAKKNGCECPDKSIGFQVCQDDGTYGACSCSAPNVGGGSNGGGSSGGASNGGAPSAGSGNDAAGNAGEATGGAAGEGAEGGAGGAVDVPVDPNDCYDCLSKRCVMEWEACESEDENNPEVSSVPENYCLSSTGDGGGQIEKIMLCITAERAKGLVKREAVRACGSSIGQSADPSFFLWPPDNMTGATAGVMNCMADALDETEPGAWADSTNIPTNGSPKPWADGTCAKLSCTSDQSGN